MRYIRVANVIEDGKFGGPQVRMIAVASAMKAKVDTTIIMPIDNSEVFRSCCDQAGVKYITLPITRITKEKSVAIRYIFCFVYEVLRIATVLRKGNFDVVHISGGSWQYKGAIAGRLVGIKILWHLNDALMPKFFRLLFVLLSRLADGFIFASKRTENYYLPLIQKKKPTFLAVAPVNTSLFNKSSVLAYHGDLSSQLKNKTIICTTANVNPVKGLECLIKSASIVQRECFDVIFVVIGAIYPSQRKYYHKLRKLAEYVLVDKIIFTGMQVDIRPLLKMTDIYLCSSVSEACPISVWEAMSMGKPIVSTDVGDVSVYVKDGFNGFVVDVGDHHAMADRLLKYIHDTNLRAEHGERCRRVAVEKLDLKFCADHHVKAYSAITSW